jgi:hypothetical protein
MAMLLVKSRITHGMVVGHLFIIIIMILFLNCFHFRFNFLKLRHNCIFRSFMEV